MKRATTICCSAIALIALAKGPAEPIPLVPTRLLWTLALNNQLPLNPVFDRDRAYFPIENDRLVAYDLPTGKQLWLVDAHAAVEPAASADLVFIAGADTLVALRALDGVVAWQQPLQEPLAVPPVWDNGWLVLAMRSGVVRALRATDGAEIWRHDLGGPTASRPALAADRVYVSVNRRIVALNVETGVQLWERRVGGTPAEILALDDRLFFGSTDDFFYCVMAKDGKVDWTWRTGGDIVGLPVTDGRAVYFVSLDNVLRALNRTTGGQLWMKGLPLRPTSGPVRAGATIVISGLSATLRTFNAKDGAAGAEISVGGEVASPPYVLSQPVTGLPMLVVVTRDIAKGASATLHVRSIDPAVTPIAPLPNPVTLPLSLPTTGPATALRPPPTPGAAPRVSGLDAPRGPRTE